MILKSFKKITKQKTVCISLTGKNISCNDYEYIMTNENYGILSQLVKFGVLENLEIIPQEVMDYIRVII